MNAKKLLKVTANIENDKNIMKNINSLGMFQVSDLISHSERWIKAIKTGGLFCSFVSVSKSGMSRKFKYMEARKGNSRYNFLQFHCFLTAMGYKPNDSIITVLGCGMDMNFNTNYNIIHRLYRLGFISKKQCSSLSRQTPTFI